MMQALGYTIFLRYLFGGIFALFLASVAMPSQPAQADFIDGRQLQLYCASQNPADEAICIVYITGAVDAFTTVDLIAEKPMGRSIFFACQMGCNPTSSKP